MDERVKPGSVVQANWKTGSWDGCTLVVNTVTNWGVQAHMSIPYKGKSYISLKWDEIEYVGEAAVTTDDE